MPEPSRPGADGPVPAPLLGGYVRGVAWTYASVAAAGASTFFLAAWSVRRVGTAQFGVFALVASLTGLLMIFDYAIGLALQRAAARVEANVDRRESEAQRAAVHAGHGAYAMLGAVAALLAVGVGGALGVAGSAGVPNLAAVVVLVGLATALQVGTAALPAVAAGCRRFSLRSGATLAGLCVRVAVALLTVGRFGVTGLAGAQLLGVVVDRLVLLSLLGRHVPWFRLRPTRPDAAALREVVGYAVPLLVLNVGAQLFAVSDLLAVGAFVGQSAVGVYQVAALLPVQASGFLMIGYNVAFPALSGSDDPHAQETATAFLTGLFSFVGGAGLGLVAILRADVVHVMLGRPSDMGESVVAVFCAVGVANLTVHGLASLLIARGHQVAMARVVAVELPVNAVLTVWFVLVYGAVGAAVATLVTVVLMDFVVFPLVGRHRFARPVLQVVLRHGLAPAGLGAAVAVAAAWAAALAPPGFPRLVLGAVAAAALGALVGLLVLGPRGRRTLADAVAADRRPAGDSVPAALV